MHRSVLHISFATLTLPFLLIPLLRGESPDTSKAEARFRVAITEGEALAHQRRYVFAIEAYRKANKIAGGGNIECLQRIYSLQIEWFKFMDAANTASQILAVANLPAERSLAAGKRGLALYLYAENHKDYFHAEDHKALKYFNEADEFLRIAIKEDPKNATAHFYEGKILARLGQFEAAADEFKLCANALPPKDPTYARAQRFAANPRLAVTYTVPAFAVKAFDGSWFNLDELTGNVVVIDFWATWCLPCLNDLDSLKKLVKKFNTRPFTMISISLDRDETVWQRYVTKNKMTWPQYRDVDGTLLRAFNPKTIPHYFIIDSDGVYRNEILHGENVEAAIEDLVAKAVEKQSAP